MYLVCICVSNHTPTLIWHRLNKFILKENKTCLSYILCDTVITWSIFSWQTPHSSPIRVRYGESFVSFNTLRPIQNGRHFADDIFKWIFLNENVWILINISLKFVPQGPINNIPALVQIMAWRRRGDKPLSGPMMDRLPTHICVTRPQWVNSDLCSASLQCCVHYHVIPYHIIMASICNQYNIRPHVELGWGFVSSIHYLFDYQNLDFCSIGPH